MQCIVITKTKAQSNRDYELTQGTYKQTIQYNLNWLSRALQKVLTSDLASCTQAQHQVIGNHVDRKQMKSNRPTNIKRNALKRKSNEAEREKVKEEKIAIK